MHVELSCLQSKKCIEGATFPGSVKACAYLTFSTEIPQINSKFAGRKSLTSKLKVITDRTGGE